MVEQEPEIVARFTPPFEGAVMRQVPNRDLTQQDIDRMTPEQRRDAYTPHPMYGTPMFTAVHPDHIDQQMEFAHAARVAADGLPELVAVPETEYVEGEAHPDTVFPPTPDYPKWFLDLIAHDPSGTVRAIPMPGETKKQYEERVAQFTPGDDAGNKDGAE